MTIFACLAITVALAAAWLPMAHAQQWSAYANISETMGTNANRLCMAEASRGDIGCPTYAPYINATSGNVGIGTTSPENKLTVAGGNIRMDNNYGLFFGTSGWYGISNNTATNTFNIGANNARITLAAVPGNVGINTTQPSTTFHVSGTLRVASGGEACDTDRAGAIRYSGNQFQVCYGSGGWANLTDASTTLAGGDRITSGTTSVIATENGNVEFRSGGTTTGYFTTGGLLAAVGVSTTERISTSTLYVSGNVGIGIGTPGANLHISQTALGSGYGLRVGYHDTAARQGRFYVSDSSFVLDTFNTDLKIISAYRTLYQALGGSWARAHNFGVASPMTYAGGTVRFMTSEAIWAPTSGPGEFAGDYKIFTINQTGTATGNYSGLYVNVVESASSGTNNALLRLTTNNNERFVVTPQGGARISSWTTIAANVSASAPLDVYGTVSATAIKLADNPDAMCGPATYGTFKAMNGRPYFCRP